MRYENAVRIVNNVLGVVEHARENPESGTFAEHDQKQFLDEIENMLMAEVMSVQDTEDGISEVANLLAAQLKQCGFDWGPLTVRPMLVEALKLSRLARVLTL